MFKILVKLLMQIKNGSVYSYYGLKAAFQDELAFRLEILAAIIALPAAYFIGKSPIERLILMSCLLLVLVVELLNSAVESILDRIDSSYHPLTKKAKDIGSAAVFITIVNAFIVWIIIIKS
jgi:diacylglycerol kinase (ATP)